MTSISTQQAPATAGGPRFAVAIVARRNNERPSEMEIQLRSHCEKVRVVEKLNGSHLLLPKEGLAVRVYYQADIERFDEIATKNRPSSASAINQVLGDRHGATGNTDDIHGLAEFRDKNHTTLVFCVLARSNLEQFDKPESFINRVQRIMRVSGNTKKGRVIFALDTPSALKSLISIADARSPRRRNRKEKYFENQRANLYIPDESGIIPQPNGAATAAREVLHEWANEYSLPDGEHHVLASYLGSLAAIATADDNALNRVPIESETKALLHLFFGSKGSIKASTNLDLETQEADIPQVVQVPQSGGPQYPAMVPQSLEPIRSPLPQRRVFQGDSVGFRREGMGYADQFGGHHNATISRSQPSNAAGFHPSGAHQTLYRPGEAPMPSATGAIYDGNGMASSRFQRPFSSFHSNAVFQTAPSSHYAPTRAPPAQQQLVPQAFGNGGPPPANPTAFDTFHHHEYLHQNQPMPHHHYGSGHPQGGPNTTGLVQQPRRGLLGHLQNRQQQSQSSQHIYNGQPPVLSNLGFHRGVRRFE